jgi:hypothetical protein
MSKPLESVLVKKPNVKQSFTEEQIHEVIKCADPINGPQYFLENYFFSDKISDF